MQSFQTIQNKISELIQEESLDVRLAGGESVSLRNVAGSALPLLLHEIGRQLVRPLCMVMPSREEAETLADELANICGEKAAFFPGGHEDKNSPVVINPRRAGLQMQVLRDLIHQNLQWVVVGPDGLVLPLPAPGALGHEELVLARGDEHDLYDLVERLIKFGYTRESLVERAGEISLRGGILDIFPFTGEEPYRIEFFGDEIDSLRTFNPATQRSTGQAPPLQIISSSLTWEERSSSILEYFPSDMLFFWQDPDLVLGEAAKLAAAEPFLFAVDVIHSRLNGRQILSCHTLAAPNNVVDVNFKSPHQLGKRAADIRNGLEALTATRESVIITCQNQEQMHRLSRFLQDDEGDQPERVDVIIAPVSRGFFIGENGPAVYTESDLFGRSSVQHRRRRFKEGVPIRELTNLKAGDFVVHIDHGIGRFSRLERITVDGHERECLTLIYRDGDKLYVPVEKMERVQKYSSKEGAEPSITKLGSGRWDKLKARTKKAIQLIAKELIALYSARQAKPGHAFAPDSNWQIELEAMFQYEETPDQDKAIQNVKSDMEKARPMDRLVCGDVGFGKTEVAMRAAFKAVMGGKQVAVLVPTTILAEQHGASFKERLGQFPVVVEVLSRFRQRAVQKDIIYRTARGEVDILIGTHRLLSNDIIFKDLGLMIIDEEQRFGVKHKEKLKSRRENVDALALSATPIPRTLQFSLLGVRDLSIINTPPKNRLPIITEVMPFDEAVIKDAIERELLRKGQIFFVHNRVKSIYAVAKMIERIVPGLKLAVAHGQMETRELEKVMMDFTNGEYQCLVSTMIIGSGVDMPRVNTLIVHRADRLGLSQLYQLRGRVGRSNRRAYAYLLTPPFSSLTPESVKRLRTIEEFTELGSGFQVALRDLEIRGAGNLLGMQQSGTIDAVGFDLYTKLVDEAVNEIKTEAGLNESAIPLVVDCRVDVDRPALIPQSYIEDENIRIGLYHRLNGLSAVEEFKLFREELVDRFGPVPDDAESLIQLAELRRMGQDAGLKRILLRENIIRLFFDESWVDSFSSSELFTQRLRSMIESSPVAVKFLQEKTFGLRVVSPETDVLAFAKKLLHTWQ
ncbi:transcription-repair coupling factor [bacterium]|nr:transcription-repair coupling factor [bacterium]